MKKLVSIVLALALVLASCAVAFADGGINLVDDNSGAATHEYKVYQVFVGDLSDGELSNVKYGANYGDAGASVPVTELQAITDARAFATSIISSLHGDPIATLTSANSFATTGLADGYYLIIDDTEKELVDGDAYSRYIVQVLGSQTNFKVKKSTTTFDKTIIADDHTEETTSPNPGIADDGKTDNVSIGDTVTYQLVGTVPAAATDYDDYFWYIQDTLSDGLTFTKADANITVTSNGEPATLVEGTNYNVVVGSDEDPYTFQIVLLNPKSFAGKTITVTYKATLNENAVMNDPNNNTAKVIYANNPEYKYDGKIENGKPKEVVPTGETPDSITKTYTTGIKIKKVDQDILALKGATFTLSGESINKVVKNVETFEEDSTGAYWKLKTGTYTTQAPITEDYVEGGVTVKKNSELYDSTTTKYKKTTTRTVEETSENVTQTLAVNDDGTLEFKGLGAGVYTITEIEAPEGYNKAAPITVTITFNNSNETFSATGNTGVEDGYFTVQVVNNAGTELPSTGGIGTTIFYVLGGLLVVGAAVILVARRKAHD